MSIAKYSEYKPSGISWLGDIPNHWEVKRAKDIADITRGAILRPVDEPLFFDDNGEWHYLNISDATICNKYLDNAKLRLSTLGSRKSARVMPNNMIITASATIGKPFINRIKVCVHDGFIPFKKVKIDINFLFYYVQISNLFCSMGKSNTQKNIYLDEVKNIIVAFPKDKEQNTIAIYLDQKTSTIDNNISLLEQKITHYQQLRKSLVNETVCRGLNKMVKLKDSGVGWIGMIPEHWKVKRLKDEYNLYTGNSISDKSLFEDKNNSFAYVSTKDIDVETGQISYDNGVYIPKVDKSFKVAKANSILLCIEGGNAGKKVGYNTKDICFVNKLCSIKGRTKNVNEKYQYYCIQSSIFQEQFFAILNGLIGGVSLNSIKFFNILYPPIQEQTAIATFLDEKSKKIDTILTNIKTQIETLKELRKALINDVVTGKIKVVE